MTGPVSAEVDAVIRAEMGKVSRALTPEQRQENGRRAWATRVRNLAARMAGGELPAPK